MKSLPSVPLALFLLTSACDAAYSPKVVKVEYQPAEQGLDDKEWSMAYNDNDQLIRVEYELNGREEVEYSYRYDDNGDFIEFNEETNSGEVVGNYTRENGFIVSVSSETAWSASTVICSNGKVDLDGDGKSDVIWEEGVLVGVEHSNEISGSCATGASPISIAFEVDSSDTIRWSEGLVVNSSSEERSVVRRSSGGDISFEEDERKEVDVDFNYSNGALVDIEASVESELDGDRSKSSEDLDFTFDDDNRVTEIDSEFRDSDGEIKGDHEIEYDSDGNIRRIEDRSGNRWEISYAEGQTSGVVFSLHNIFLGGHQFRLDGSVSSSFAKGNLVSLKGIPMIR
ncbi:MAG: hypothetical protein GY822_00360 [Deltaproteobacteria bacterium]|nr:hypothetical protein [Deltaproteobacteria bacterium]